ncbi:MAG: WD40 repeat domain-containing protein [Planctomycetes bacterium]|nr:WD40 repeat domain-containing protein [Planctomycetota bacterium]
MNPKRLVVLVAIALVLGGAAFAAIWHFGRISHTTVTPPESIPPALPTIDAALIDLPAPHTPAASAFFDPAKPEVKELHRLNAGSGGETIAFTPDGQFLVSAGYGDNAIKVWDWRSRQEISSRTHAHRINDMVIAPHGDGIWTVDAYQHLYFWTFAGGTVGAGKQVGKDLGNVPYLAVSPNGALVATTSFDNKLMLWDAKLAALIGEVAMPQPLRRAAFSPDGKRLVVSTNTNQLIEYTLASGQGRWLHILPVKADTECSNVTFSPDGKRFSTGHTQPWVTVWEAESMTYQRWLKFPMQAPTAVTYTRDSKWAVIAVNRNGIYAWNPDVHEETGAALNLKPGHDFIRDLAFSPDGKVLASVDDSGTIVLWSAS